MLSFTTIIASIAATSTVVLAQTGTPNASFNSSIISQIAGEIGSGTQAAWCNSQYRACNVLCDQGASTNQCTPSTLAYNCTCSSNSSSPAFQYYNPTMLSNICNRALGDCLAANAGLSAEQANCQSTIICGNASVDAYASTTHTSSSVSSTSTPTATDSQTSGTASPTTHAGAANALILDTTAYATGIFGAALLAAFGLFL